MSACGGDEDHNKPDCKCQSRDSARPYSTSLSVSRTSANHEAVITDVARVSGCFIVDVSTPCFPYRNDSRMTGGTSVGGRRENGERKQPERERRRASSSTVERWEHKIEDVLGGRLHRSSISSQLVHSVLAQTYLWPYPPSIRLCRRTCGPGAIHSAARLQFDPSEPRRPVSYSTLFYLSRC